MSTAPGKSVTSFETVAADTAVLGASRKTVRVAEPSIGDLELDYVTDAVRQGQISSMGSYVRRFEETFATFCDVPHALSCSNGSVALHLALLGLEVGSGDEVIVPALTFVATANAVVHAGGTPVFADVHPAHWGLDPEAVARKITPRTKAIIVVHLYGHPADLDPLMELCNRHGLFLIEDAAEAHGARYHGRPVGGIGHVGTFSFYGNKILTTGEGGMVTTRDSKVAARMNLFKNHGADPARRYWHPVIGYNYRMANLQAALGVAQVERAGELLEMKRQIAREYRKQLQDLPLTLQPEQPWAEPVYWMISALVDDRAPLTSEGLQRELATRGIETRPFFPPLPGLPPYDVGEVFPVAATLARTGLSLPSGPKLELNDVRRVAHEVRALLS